MINKIIIRNFNSIVKRGLINKHTTKHEFITKLYEEVSELSKEKPKTNEFNEELADVILVAFNIAKFYNVDIEKELINKIIKNEKR